MKHLSFCCICALLLRLRKKDVLCKTNLARFLVEDHIVVSHEDVPECYGRTFNLKEELAHGSFVG